MCPVPLPVMSPSCSSRSRWPEDLEIRVVASVLPVGPLYCSGYTAAACPFTTSSQQMAAVLIAEVIQLLRRCACPMQLVNPAQRLDPTASKYRELFLWRVWVSCVTFWIKSVSASCGGRVAFLCLAGQRKATIAPQERRERRGPKVGLSLVTLSLGQAKESDSRSAGGRNALALRTLVHDCGATAKPRRGDCRRLAHSA